MPFLAFMTTRPRGSIWYISKYLALPSLSRTEGGRVYELMRELGAQRYEVLTLVSDSNHLADVPEVTGTHLIEEVRGGSDLLDPDAQVHRRQITPTNSVVDPL